MDGISSCVSSLTKKLVVYFCFKHGRPLMMTLTIRLITKYKHNFMHSHRNITEKEEKKKRIHNTVVNYSKAASIYPPSRRASVEDVLSACQAFSSERILTSISHRFDTESHGKPS